MPYYYERGKKEVDRREGREEEGICRTNVKLLPTPLLNLERLALCMYVQKRKVAWALRVYRTATVWIHLPSAIVRHTVVNVMPSIITTELVAVCITCPWAPAGMGKGEGTCPPPWKCEAYFCLAYVASLQERGRYSIKPRLLNLSSHVRNCKCKIQFAS